MVFNNSTGSHNEDDRCGGADIHSNENVDQATKHLIAKADDAVQNCNDVLIAHFDVVGRKLPTETVVARVFAAYCAIVAVGGQAQFLIDRKIKVHGSTKNPCYPIFRAFTKGTHPWLRDRVCKYAEVAALAIHQNIAPEMFSEWLKSHPIEKACSEYRKIKRELEKAEQSVEQRHVSEFLVNPRKDPDKAPQIAATPLTVGYVGLKLGVIDFSEDGSGAFRILGIMPHDKQAILRMVKTAAAAAG